MRPIARGIFLLLIFLTINSSRLLSQPVLTGDASHPERRVERALGGAGRSSGPDTLLIGPGVPFRDDFAYAGSLPDSALWYVPSSLIDVPQLSTQGAVNPPSRGVLTFDGADRFNRAYDVLQVGRGIADRLFSHYINLSAYGPGDQLFLSFRLQPQGLGDRPESTDSFRVYFRTPLAPPQEFRKVLAVPGSSLRPFRAYIIPLDDPLYFHEGFQLLFESLGSVNGAADRWHLDYVELGLGRSPGDTLYNDRSPILTASPPLAPYTALPWWIYGSGGSGFQPFDLNVSNLGSGTVASLRARISEVLGPLPLQGVVSSQAQENMPPRSVSTFTYPPFSDQTLSGPAAFELEVSLLSPPDESSANDQYRVRYPIDSLMGYDDGEADAGFGLNQPLGFGLRYDLPAPDSLTAVWICFVPTVHYNPVNTKVTYLDGHPFRLAIWNQPHPDSLLEQLSAGMEVRYGSRPNEFQRYSFSKPIPVPSRFWIGIQQIDALPLGVGYDLSYNRDNFTYWDSLGIWTNVQRGGVLMIRPEFYNPLRAPAAAEAPAQAPLLRLRPQPLRGGWVEVGGLPPQARYEAQLFDLQGRLLASFSLLPGGEARFRLPEGLPPGLYAWRHQLTQGGNQQIFSEKLLLQP